MIKNKKGSIANRRKPHVLIIDDNVILIDVIRVYFRGDYKITAFSGNNCYDSTIEYIEGIKNKPHVAIVDLLLHNGKNGIDLTRELSNSGVNNIIFFTGCSENDQLYISAKNTGHEIINKPIDLKVLKEEIDKYIV